MRRIGRSGDPALNQLGSLFPVERAEFELITHSPLECPPVTPETADGVPLVRHRWRLRFV